MFSVVTVAVVAAVVVQRKWPVGEVEEAEAKLTPEEDMWNMDLIG